MDLVLDFLCPMAASAAKPLQKTLLGRDVVPAGQRASTGIDETASTFDEKTEFCSARSGFEKNTYIDNISFLNPVPGVPSGHSSSGGGAGGLSRAKQGTRGADDDGTATAADASRKITSLRASNDVDEKTTACCPDLCDDGTASAADASRHPLHAHIENIINNTECDDGTAQVADTSVFPYPVPSVPSGLCSSGGGAGGLFRAKQGILGAGDDGSMNADIDEGTAVYSLDHASNDVEQVIGERTIACRPDLRDDILTLIY